MAGNRDIGQREKPHTDAGIQAKSESTQGAARTSGGWCLNGSGSKILTVWTSVGLVLTTASMFVPATTCAKQRIFTLSSVTYARAYV